MIYLCYNKNTQKTTKPYRRLWTVQCNALATTQMNKKFDEMLRILALTIMSSPENVSNLCSLLNG